MALTDAQQRQLDALLAEQDRPPYRTQGGVAGILHQLADSAAGIVPHRSPQAWDELHEAIEAAAGDGGGEDKPAKGTAAKDTAAAASK